MSLFNGIFSQFSKTKSFNVSKKSQDLRQRKVGRFPVPYNGKISVPIFRSWKRGKIWLEVCINHSIDMFLRYFADATFVHVYVICPQICVYTRLVDRSSKVLSVWISATEWIVGFHDSESTLIIVRMNRSIWWRRSFVGTLYSLYTLKICIPL